MSQQNTVGAHKTTVATDSRRITRITYQQTVVVEFSQEAIVLDSGTWKTATTKTRMNQASNQFNLGFSVFQKDFEWFVNYRGTTQPFNDGMILGRA